MRALGLFVSSLSTLVVVALAGTATAQPAVQAHVEQPERHHSLNVNPLGVAYGSYNLNYEYLAGAHGLVVEGGAYHAGGEDSSVTTGNVAAGWRWHWRGRQNSGFVGAMLGFAAGTAKSTVGDAMPETFDISVKVLTATANIGKRWQLDNGLNITFRVGAGYARRSFSTDSTDPDAQDAVDDINDVMAFLPIAFDGELSLGYSF